MSKKRVHELAKELGLDNREAVLALQAAGISVKTHSSSVYEEEALAVLNKVKGPTPAPAAPSRRPGMVIVKKSKVQEADEVSETEPNVSEEEYTSDEVEPIAAEAAYQAESDDRANEPQVNEESFAEQVGEDAAALADPASFVEVQEVEAVKPTPQISEQVAQQTAATTAPDEAAASASAQKATEEQGAVASSETMTEQKVPVETTTVPATPAYQKRPSGPTGGQQHPGGRRPDNRTGNKPPPVVQTRAPRPGQPSTTPATVVRMIDRDKLLERVPGRRLGGGPGARPGGDNRPRPGQGARPGGARPAGAAGAGAAGPNGPRYGQVTELRVVNDPFGRGREMVTVGRDKKKAGGVAGAGGPGGAGKGGVGARRGRPGGGKRDMNDMRERSMHPSRLKKKKSNKRLGGVKAQLTQPKASKRVIKMKETIVVADLAHEMGVKAVDLVRNLMALGNMVTQNQSVDYDTAVLLATEFGYTVDSVAFTENAHLQTPAVDENAAQLQTRPPVVTIMGHVDHGKTSLLDAIRKARVAAGEAGGITQHIGAYSVPVPGKGSVTFLDTPGHAAFTAMRARGAQVTDIVVLVVAADDGLMPQTEEAIKHAQAAKVPIIVALNKMDKPDANPDRVMQELTKFNLLPEAWGGETMFVQTSATKGTGIAELLESILLQAEVLELKANPERAAIGVVVEAQLDRGRGPVATVLVSQGTLKRGDAIVVGCASGKIRAMMDDQGRQLKTAGPSTAVEITGLDVVPEAGDTLNTVETAEGAREIAQHRLAGKRAAENTGNAATSLDDLMKRMQGASMLELKLVLKADVQGSAEAVRAALEKLSTDEVKVNVIYGGVGAISESDIMLAAASRGLVLGFGVRPDTNARSVADREHVEIRTYNIIYEAVDDVTRAMEGLLTPESREKVVGRAEVRDLFRVSKVGVIGGCRVLDGKAMRAARVRVLRDSVQVFDGKVSSLKHFKNDAREVDAGSECGVGVDGFNDLKNGDVIEFYQVEEIARSLGAPKASRPTPTGNAEAHP